MGGERVRRRYYETEEDFVGGLPKDPDREDRRTTCPQTAGGFTFSEFESQIPGLSKNSRQGKGEMRIEKENYSIKIRRRSQLLTVNNTG